MSFDPQLLLHGDLTGFIRAIGYIGVFTIVFIESGLLVGFFFPGDSLLFTAGFLSSQGYFDILVLVVGAFTSAVLGDSIGYLIGSKFGKKLYQREKSFFFRKDHLIRTHSFYERHGGKTIVLARFMPVARTFAPIVAGLADMKYSTFLFFNLLGGVLWAIGITLAGFYLGSAVPNVDKYLLPIVGVIILLSVAPGIIHIVKERK